MSNSSGVWASATGQPGMSAYESYRRITIASGEEPLDEAAWVESIAGGDGVAIQAVEVMGNGQLQVTMSDGSQMITEGYARPAVGMEGSVVRWSYDGGKTWIDGNDVRGPKGSDGEQGPAGPRGVSGEPGKDSTVPGPMGQAPKHKWSGTSLSFENPDGSYGTLVDLKGSDAVLPFSILGPITRIGRIKNLSVDIGSLSNGSARKTVPCPGIQPDDTVYWSFMDGSTMPSNLVPGGAWCITAGQLTISYTVSGLLLGISLGSIKISASWFGD